MIEIKNISKSYDNKEVIRIENLSISQGETVGLVGNNGAGKTTLLSLILDLIKADTGEILSKGENVSNTEEWKMYTSAYLDDSFLIGFLKPDEYFEFLGKLYDLNPADVDRFTEQFESVFNGEVRGQQKFIRDLSMGNRKKTGLVGSLIGSPEVLLWDEPFSNLDPSTQMRIRTLVEKQKEAGRTSIISSHDLHHVYEVCERILILDQGKLVKDILRKETTREELFDYFGVRVDS